MMKRCVLAFALAAAFSLSSASAQDIPLATRPGLFQVGAGYSNGATDEVSKRISGASAFATFDVTEHLGAEVDVHYLNFGTSQDYAQEMYLIGPRYVYRINRFEPYAKILVGIGHSDAQQPFVHVPGTPGSYFAVSFGGGLDIRIHQFNDKFSIRAVDIERQDWPGFSPNGLTPTVLTFGAAYHIR